MSSNRDGQKQFKYGREIDQYIEWGFDAIPLRPFTKRPLCNAWSSIRPDKQWEDAPEDVNVGIRCGGANNIAVLDADDKNKPGTALAIQNHLLGLGINPKEMPIVKTASGVGKHTYFRLEENLEGNMKQLRGDLAGEFRYGPGAIVVAPPSEFDNTRYELVNGDFRNLPILSFQDIAPLVEALDTLVPLPAIPTVCRQELVIPRNAMPILMGNYHALYSDRSSAEQALTQMLVNAGYSFDEVLSLFLSYPGTGKFRERYQKDPDSGVRYLRNGYDKAVARLGRQSEVRQQIQRNQAWMENVPWNGRGGSSDRAVYYAHCQIAYRAGRIEYHASARELAEFANANAVTVSRANKRLVAKGLIQLVSPDKGSKASVYRLTLQWPGQTATLIPPSLCEGVLQFVQHDTFAYHGLGKSAAEVYEILIREGALTVGELSEKTGRSRKTVQRALSRLCRIDDPLTGERIYLVEQDDPCWYAIKADESQLNRIAEILGTNGLGAKRKERHLYERDQHKRLLSKRQETSR